MKIILQGLRSRRLITQGYGPPGGGVVPGPWVEGRWTTFDVPPRTLQFNAPSRTLEFDVPPRTLEFDVDPERTIIG